MVQSLAFHVVLVAGLYLCVLAVASLCIPSLANRFLLGFAGSPRAHYTELLIRVVVGGSFVVYSPRMLLPTTFAFFGWVLLVTTGILLVLPWRWHHRFAQLVVPQANRYITLIGWCSLAFGGLILAAVFLGTLP